MSKCKGPSAVLLAGSLLLSAVGANAGGKIAIDDTKWISIGAAARGSFSTVEDSAPDGDWSTDFNADSARIYVNGQIHQYIKFELNTEYILCGNSALEEFALLDAIAKFEINPYFNVWAGRLLVPAERQELNGPYYSTTYDAFKTPFVSSDFSVNFGGGGAGVYERDHGVNVWARRAPAARCDMCSVSSVASNPRRARARIRMTTCSTPDAWPTTSCRSRRTLLGRRGRTVGYRYQAAGRSSRHLELLHEHRLTGQCRGYQDLAYLYQERQAHLQ